MDRALPHRSAPRPLLAIVAIGAALALGLLAFGKQFTPDNVGFRSATKLTPAHLKIPTTSLLPMPTDLPSTDSRFIARLTRLAEQGGYPLGNPDQLLTAARELCAMVSSGEPLPGASAALMTGYEFGGRQAAAIGATAVDMYCPESKR